MGGKGFEYDLEELYKWIDNYTLSRQKRNISRDFSDAVPLAEILKQHYPKLVELHNYTAINSVSQKLINWQTLNKRVLSKLDIHLTNTMMEQLTHAVPGVIEKLLFEVKAKIETKPPEKVNQDVYFLEGLSASISGAVIPIRQKDGTKVTDHKIIPVDTYTKMENELKEKHELINTLKNKNQHLEALLVIKDERINDLTKQIQQMSPNDSSLSSSVLIKGGTKLFNKLF